MAPISQFHVTKSRSRTTTKNEARERLNDVIKAYEEAGGSLSITQEARLYVVSKATLYCMIYGGMVGYKKEIWQLRKETLITE